MARAAAIPVAKASQPHRHRTAAPVAVAAAWVRFGSAISSRRFRPLANGRLPGCTLFVNNAPSCARRGRRIWALERPRRARGIPPGGARHGHRLRPPRSARPAADRGRGVPSASKPRAAPTLSAGGGSVEMVEHVHGRAGRLADRQLRNVGQRSRDARLRRIEPAVRRGPGIGRHAVDQDSAAAGAGRARASTRLGNDESWVEARPSTTGGLSVKFRLDYGSSSADRPADAAIGRSRPIRFAASWPPAARSCWKKKPSG